MRKINGNVSHMLRINALVAVKTRNAVRLAERVVYNEGFI
jgi:hypothetical protein